MGEQSKEGDSDEAASYNPFLLSTNEYDAATRLRMAEDIASSRRLYVSPALKEIMGNPENFFHEGQQSWKMADDANRRHQASFNTMREARIQQRRAKGMPLPSKIEMIEINPTRVTLSLEFESQYYALMTNDYGEHENVASIMKETNTLIQFPDRIVEGSCADPYAQQVTITGHYSEVDRARKLMRQNCHVSVVMSLSELKVVNSDVHAFIGQNAVKHVEVSFVFKEEKKGTVKSYLRFTSREKNQGELTKMANKVFQRFHDNSCTPDDLFSLHFTLTRYHVEQVIGSSSTKLFMPEIEKCTKTRIIYPSHSNNRENPITLEIKGSVDNILEARRYIMDLLPISMYFNMRDTDMAHPTNPENRVVNLVHEQSQTSIKVCRSVYEPCELLSEEVPLHCAILRTREFRIKEMYTTYQMLLSKKVGVDAPHPTDYDKSIWHNVLPEAFAKYDPAPCRAELDIPGNARRSRTASLCATRQKLNYEGKSKSCSESSENVTRHNTRVPSSISECATQPLHQLPAFPELVTQSPFGQMFMMQHAYMKGAPSLHPVPIFPVFLDPAGIPLSAHPDNFQFDAFNFFTIQTPVMPVNEADHATYRPESSNSIRAQNDIRKPLRSTNRPATAMDNLSTANNGQSRVFEKVRSEDPRSSPRSGPRRASISGDDPSNENFDDRRFGRHYQRSNHRYPKDDGMYWKPGNYGDNHGKRNGQFRSSGNFRDQEINNENVGSFERASSADQIQFQSTHHLPLKPNEIDLDRERLFTHDSPQCEHPGGSYGNELPGDLIRMISSASLNEGGRRSRAVSHMDRDDQPTRFTDADCKFGGSDHAMTHSSRSIDSYKKGSSVTVNKTMLEPKSRNEREYGKISLEHKEKQYTEFAEGEKYADNGLHAGNTYRIHPMQLIAEIHQSSEQLPRISERQFADILNEKGRELAASRERNSESTLVQESSMDETSTMNCAFHNGHSPEKIL